MADPHYLKEGDVCQLNPLNCTDGLSFSIWEKIVYEDNPLS